MRKIAFLTLLLVLLMGGVVLAQDMSGIDPSGQSIVYWHQYRTDSAQDIAITKLIDEFNATNEYGITVEGIYQGSYSPIQDLMESAIQSGDLPNLVAAYANAAASWAVDGFVVDLMPYYTDATWGFSDEDKADFSDGILAVDTLNYGPFENTLIAWPNQISAQVLVVNTDILSELGYDHPPQTFAEFKEMACAAAASTTEDGAQRQGYGFGGGASEFESFVAAQGGNIFDYEADAYTFTTPEVLAVFELFQGLYADGCGYYSDQPFGWQADFNAGLNIMFLNSTAGFTFVIDGFANTGYNPNWIATLLPAGDAGSAIQLFVPSVAVVTSTPEKQLASWIFLKFMAEKQNQAAWSTGTGYFPLRTSVSGTLEEAEFARPDIYPYYMASLNLLNDPNVSVYSSPPFASYSVVRGLMDTAIADVTVNGMDVMEVAQRLEAEANAVHAEQ